jgi:hypothetical protein
LTSDLSSNLHPSSKAGRRISQQTPFVEKDQGTKAGPVYRESMRGVYLALTLVLFSPFVDGCTEVYSSILVQLKVCVMERAGPRIMTSYGQDPTINGFVMPFTHTPRSIARQLRPGPHYHGASSFLRVGHILGGHTLPCMRHVRWLCESDSSILSVLVAGHHGLGDHLFFFSQRRHYASFCACLGNPPPGDKPGNVESGHHSC